MWCTKSNKTKVQIINGLFLQDKCLLLHYTNSGMTHKSHSWKNLHILFMEIDSDTKSICTFSYSLLQSNTSHMTISGTHLSLLILWSINSKYSHRNDFFLGIIHFADTGLWYPPFTKYRTINHIKKLTEGELSFNTWEVGGEQSLNYNEWITTNVLDIHIINYQQQKFYRLLKKNATWRWHGAHSV